MEFDSSASFQRRLANAFKKIGKELTDLSEWIEEGIVNATPTPTASSKTVKNPENFSGNTGGESQEWIEQETQKFHYCSLCGGRFDSNSEFMIHSENGTVQSDVRSLEKIGAINQNLRDNEDCEVASSVHENFEGIMLPEERETVSGFEEMVIPTADELEMLLQPFSQIEESSNREAFTLSGKLGPVMTDSRILDAPVIDVTLDNTKRREASSLIELNEHSTQGERWKKANRESEISNAEAGRKNVQNLEKKLSSISDQASSDAESRIRSITPVKNLLKNQQNNPINLFDTETKTEDGDSGRIIDLRPMKSDEILEINGGSNSPPLAPTSNIKKLNFSHIQNNNLEISGQIFGYSRAHGESSYNTSYPNEKDEISCELYPRIRSRSRSNSRTRNSQKRPESISMSRMETRRSSRLAKELDPDYEDEIATKLRRTRSRNSVRSRSRIGSNSGIAENQEDPWKGYSRDSSTEDTESRSRSPTGKEAISNKGRPLSSQSRGKRRGRPSRRGRKTPTCNQFAQDRFNSPIAATKRLFDEADDLESIRQIPRPRTSSNSDSENSELNFKGFPRQTPILNVECGVSTSERPLARRFFLERWRGV